jgi:DNA polymerase III, subunit gamma and tau
MRLALYRKWRPVTFDEVCGQEHITSILKYEVANNKTTHAYLFSGSRGTGKTTCAKIMAKAVNCLNPDNGNPCGKCEACVAIDNEVTTDILEMDAASNTGVEYIRDIKDEVVYAPSMMRSRVYIIDEVHMLSVSAFNALLKTLEEPPDNVVFILATTEPQKIPATVLSRCQRFDFRRISNDVIADRLEYIAEQENINVERDAAVMIARLAQGGMRDAISMLELCSGEINQRITEEVVLNTAGVSGREQIAGMCEAVLNNDIEHIFKCIADLYVSSKDIGVFWSDMLAYYRDMLIVKSTVNPEKYLDLTKSEYNDIKKLADKYTMEKLLYHCKVMDDTYVSMQYSNISKRLCAEMTLVRMANNQYDTSTDSLAARVAALETKSTMPMTTVEHAETPKVEKPLKPKVQRELKALQCWADLVRKYDSIDKSISSLLARSKGYSDGVNIIVIVTSSFEIHMIDNDNVKSKIAALLISLTDTMYEVGDIKVELKKQNNSDNSYIDDFVDN